MSRIVDSALRVALTGAHRLLRGGWLVRRQMTCGAHAFALSPSGRLVLVKLRYAPGWRIPGGGRAQSEDPVAAALRELREEIGLVSHGQVRLVLDMKDYTDFEHDADSLVIVRDAIYRPHRWSWEVEAVREFDLDCLPGDMSPLMEKWISELRARL